MPHMQSLHFMATKAVLESKCTTALGLCLASVDSHLSDRILHACQFREKITACNKTQVARNAASPPTDVAQAMVCAPVQ